MCVCVLFLWSVVNLRMYVSPSTMAPRNPLLYLSQLKTIQRMIMICVHVSTMTIFGN